ncbi:MAG: peptidyl-prolyl cis-trans isomerase [Candidatus Aminicenantes bacterium]|nr:MAG: peptidyl-prolyl cis-trans isomerase [Candidatus Aminicenantes bacterium]
MKLLKSKLKWFSFLGVVIFIFVHCGREKTPESSADSGLWDPQKRNNVILDIGGSLYFNSDFEEHVQGAVGDDYNSLSLPSLSRLFDSFVEEKILLQTARSQNITLTWEEKKEYLAKVSNEFWFINKKAALEEGDVEILFDRLLIEKYTYEIVKDIEISDEEIKEYYNLHKREFLRPERVRVSQILLETEDKAIEVYERVKFATEEGFRKVAQEESIGVEASKGGEMGVFELGQLPFEMEKVVFSLKVGELSPVVESTYGYHIFRLDERYEAELISEEKASSSLRVKLLDQKIKQSIAQHIEDLMNSLEWTFYPQNLSFPYQRNNL